MPNITKPYSAAMHQESERWLHRLLEKHATQWNYELNVNPYGPYGVDALLRKIVSGYSIDLHVELEMRPGWIGGFWPWGSVHIPARKRKDFGLARYTYLAFRGDGGAACAVRGDVLLQCPVITHRNRHVDSGEQFVNVPVARAAWIDIRHSEHDWLDELWDEQYAPEPMRVKTRSTGDPSQATFQW